MEHRTRMARSLVLYSLSFLWILALAMGFFGGASISTAQTPSSNDADNPLRGGWVGWLETPAQHLRIVIRIETTRASDDDITLTECQGTITSPDQSPTSLPLTSFTVADDGKVAFRVQLPSANATSYSFEGKRDGEKITGTLEQNGAKLPLEFQFTTTIPEETKERLGASTAWTGELDLVVRKLAIRFRVYNAPPYATPETPRVLFDSIAENANGFPVTISEGDKGQALFAISGIPGNAKYFATVDPSMERIQGKFLQGMLPLSLTLTRIEELKDKPNDSDPLVSLIRTRLQQAAEKAKTAAAAEVPAKPTEEGQPRSAPAGIQEENFAIERVNYRASKVKIDGRWTHPTFRIAGTITWPANRTPESRFPAVVMISGSGPQDRDETIGRHQLFRDLAHWFASQGIATLRYDDRGVGESTGDFLASTSADFAEDAQAVWNHAREVQGIDALRVGFLGHSEGGMIAPMIAANNLNVAFLILLAPPGLPGGDILATQIDRMAELQGVPVEVRRSTNELQLALQELALRDDPNQELTKAEVRQAVLQRWDTLSKIANAPEGQDNEALKKRIVDQITLQFQGLCTPWMRYFLQYDPSPNWIMMRSPTLAIWGEKDTQVLPYLSRDHLRSVVEHNPKLRADMVVLSDLNHLMQRAESGLPSEYDTIEETIDPSVLETIREWMNQLHLLP